MTELTQSERLELLKHLDGAFGSALKKFAAASVRECEEKCQEALLYPADPDLAAGFACKLGVYGTLLNDLERFAEDGGMK